MKKSKKLFKKFKKEILIGLGVVILVALSVVLLVTNISKPKEKEETPEELEHYRKEDSNRLKEQDIIDVYNFSKEDAIELVKTGLNSDNFEFEVYVTDDGKYLVVVKNIINDNEYKYEVDPVYKEFYEV